MLSDDATILLGALGPIASLTAVGGAFFGLKYNAKQNLKIQTLQFEQAQAMAKAERVHADGVAKAERLRAKGEVLFWAATEWMQANTESAAAASVEDSNLAITEKQKADVAMTKLEVLIHLHFLSLTDAVKKMSSAGIELRDRLGEIKSLNRDEQSNAAYGLVTIFRTVCLDCLNEIAITLRQI
jgi:hypothetical protein